MDLLIKKKKSFFTKFKEIFISPKITEKTYEELEELLIQSDISFDMTLEIVNNLEKNLKLKNVDDLNLLYDELKKIMVEKLECVNYNDNFLIDCAIEKPTIVFVVGVNGVGKTTSIAKISNYLKNNGKKVLVGAADTFRAAAVEQIYEWCLKNDIDIVKNEKTTDPASIVYECMEKLKLNKYDTVIIDTAGRLQNKANLMKELEKMYNMVKNKSDNVNIECLLVLDSTTGQNAIKQAKDFNDVCDLTGIILTKFDGSAKGGVVFSVTELLKKPVRFVGIGEKVNDLEIFNKEKFVNSFFE